MAEEKTSKKRYQFKAEVSQLLNILTHSLYTQREIFIRELISNAADALDKARLKEVMGEKIADPDLDLKIRIHLDKEAKTMTISDTGIGMTRDELVQNIGTIARSGTSEFLKQLGDNTKESINLIGKFGVGFYSVFMAGKNVEVTSKSANSKEPAYTWISDGEGSFKISEVKEKVRRGTTIRVQLRDDAEEFADEFRVKNIIETYSNFVPFPIFLEKEQINKISAIWREPKSTVKKKQYEEFFKFIARQSDSPLTKFHFSSDVPVQFHTLLFVPKSSFEKLGFGKDEEGIHLFVKRVLVDAKANDVLPPYLRFVRGVLESDDLPLNISRETLQENPHLFKITSTVVSKFLTHLDAFAKKDESNYTLFWKEHGRVLKEGYADFTHKEKVAALFRFNSSKCEDGDALVSFDTYIDRMHQKQDEIYFLSGPSREALESNPVVEIFKSKGIEVLYCYDPVDEFVLPGLMTYKEKKIISADHADMAKLADIESEASKDNDQKEKKISEETIKDLEKLTRRMKNILSDKVEDVKLSERLVDSPAVLVAAQKGMSSQMEKIMHMVNQETKLSQKILEINKRHPMILQMLDIYKANVKDRMLTQIVNNLYNSVVLLDGSIDDPHAIATTMQDLLAEMTKMHLKGKSNSKD